MATENDNPFKAFPESCLLSQGAEARLYTSSLCGRPCVIKERFAKKYRHPELDTKITQQRLTQEARALARCRELGIQCPALYAVDKVHATLYMEYIEDATTAKDYINQHSSGDDGPRNETAQEMGRIVGILHKHGIIHGDLTTSNLLRKNTGEYVRAVLIDFGLTFISKLEEDMAVDLYVLERALSSSHAHTEEMMTVLLRAYTQAAGSLSASVLKKLQEVRLRGRKKTMLG
eukprot:gene3804-8380_t